MIGAGVTGRDAIAAGRRPEAMTRADVLRSLRLVEGWVERNEYRGYEPFDGLSSWARPLACGTELGERILQQIVRQSPWNLRPLLGIGRQESTKARGFMARGWLTLFRATGRPEYVARATECLEWLAAHKAPRFRDHGWSNHYDFAGRGGRYTKDDPILVWTSLIGHAYLEAFELTGRDWFLDVAESACRWILHVPRERTARGDCLSYLADRQLSIHNANMLGAGLLARVGGHAANEEYRAVARSAMEYSCSRQHPDGSWWYAEEPRYRWIDNFHTGYNLDSLKYYVEATGDEELRPNLGRGLAFFKEHFVDGNGRPRYYHSRTYPLDIQCAAQTIDTLALFADGDPECLDLAGKVAAWTVRTMQDPAGYFYYRRYPLLTATTPMLHWGQATMFKALAHLLLRLTEGAPATGLPREAQAPPPTDPLARPARGPRRRRWTPYRAIKPALDVVGSLTLLVVLSPLFLLIAALVKLTSPGPVFYGQVRIGRMMKPFTMFKFRTMHVDADHSVHQEFVSRYIQAGGEGGGSWSNGFFKLTDDPRVTPIGRFLRRTSLDELPQLWNVLRGDMSLVGPRPPLPYEVEQYEPWHRRRVLEAKPGVTGLWQIAGRSRTTFDEMVRLDLEYARTCSFWTDLRILLATPAAVISGRGAV